MKLTSNKLYKLSEKYGTDKSSHGYVHYYDELFESTYFEQNKKIREHSYKNLDSLIISNAPIIPLYYDKVMRFTHKNVYGLKTNPVNQLDLRMVYKK